MQDVKYKVVLIYAHPTDKTKVRVRVHLMCSMENPEWSAKEKRTFVDPSVWHTHGWNPEPLLDVQGQPIAGKDPVTGSTLQVGGVEYDFPLPNDNTGKLDKNGNPTPMPAFATPGRPTNEEIDANVAAIARHWVAQLQPEMKPSILERKDEDYSDIEV